MDDKKVIEQTIDSADPGTDESGRFRVLSNGAVYDNQLKHIVKGAALTSDGARALVEKRVENRRAVVRAAANSNPRAVALASEYGVLAFLAAMTEAQMAKATNPADPKSTEAANWIARYTGEAEEGNNSGSESAIDDLRGLVRDIADLARAVSDANSGHGPYVEGESS